MHDIEKKIKKINNEIGLEFDAEEHVYYINDYELKHSVSKISNESDFDFSQIPNIEFYRNIGTTIHAIVEDTANVILGEIEDFEEEEELYINVKENTEKLLEEYKPLASELLIVEPKWQLAGMFDLLVEKDGELYLLDFKTSNNVLASHKWQINIYNTILKRIYDINIDHIMIVKIDKKTGKFDKKIIDSYSNEKVVEFLLERIIKLGE